MNARSLFTIAFVVVLVVAQTTNAQSGDWAGIWAGTINVEAPGGMELTISRDGSTWKSSLRLRVQGREIVLPVRDFVLSGDSLTFNAPLNGGRVAKFAGKFEGDKLTGSVEIFENEKRVGAGTFAIVRGGEMPTLPVANPGQMADPNFNAKVTKPAYQKNGPGVLFDEAHNNFHTASGRYKPFADLITNDGYQISPGKEKFSAATLKAYKLLIISNALGAPDMDDSDASKPAFTAEESDAVRDWVRKGGALLLIADHAPMGSANQILGQRFGIDMSKKYTRDSENFQKESGNQGFIVYTRESGRLADHPITRGKNKSQRVNKVIAFTGQSLKGPSNSFAFMRLADSAQDVFGQESPVSAAGRAQGIAMKFGKGRVVFMGEAGMLTAQVIGPQRSPFGMNVPGIDNRQLVLNIMHWLTRKI